jgi:hypothetical protein
LERAASPYIEPSEYIEAARRLDNAAAEYGTTDEVTAGRLRRLATAFRKRAVEALTVERMGMDRWLPSPTHPPLTAAQRGG